jgi:hypothetical protein
MNSEKISPTGLARDAVTAWNRVSYGGDRYAVLRPWNQLVEHFGEDEATDLVFLVLSAEGLSDASYEAFSLKDYARARSEEVAAATDDEDDE